MARRLAGGALALAVVALLAADGAVVAARTAGSSAAAPSSALSAAVGASELEEAPPNEAGRRDVAVPARPTTGERAGPASSSTMPRQGPRPTTTTTTPTTVPVSTSTSTSTVPVERTVAGVGVYVVAPDGTGIVRLTSGYESYSWAPDSTRLAVADGGSLVVVRADGSQRTTIGAAGTGVLIPAWSPDGRRIAFTRSQGGAWVVPVDGASPAVQVDPDADLIGWTPDSRLVVITVPATGRASSVRLYEAGGTRRELAQDAIPYLQPAVSPDGRWVAYQGNGITVAATDGSGGRSLTGLCCGNESAGSPLSWAPDSRSIAYIDGPDVRAINVDGAGGRTLAAAAVSPSWAPDGSRLAVIDASATRADGLLHLTLQIQAADGTGRHLVLDAGQRLSATTPAWSPNGRLLALRILGGVGPLA